MRRAWLALSLLSPAVAAAGCSGTHRDPIASRHAPRPNLPPPTSRPATAPATFLNWPTEEEVEQNVGGDFHALLLILARQAAASPTSLGRPGDEATIEAVITRDFPEREVKLDVKIGWLSADEVICTVFDADDLASYNFVVRRRPIGWHVAIRYLLGVV